MNGIIFLMLLKLFLLSLIRNNLLNDRLTADCPIMRPHPKAPHIHGGPAQPAIISPPLYKL